MMYNLIRPMRQQIEKESMIRKLSKSIKTMMRRRRGKMREEKKQTAKYQFSVIE